MKTEISPVREKSSIVVSSVHARRRPLFCACEHGERSAEQRAADAEAERVDLSTAADLARDIERLITPSSR